MKGSKYSESQIVFAIKQVETGNRIHEVTGSYPVFSTSKHGPEQM